MDQPVSESQPPAYKV